MCVCFFPSLSPTASQPGKEAQQGNCYEISLSCMFPTFHHCCPEQKDLNHFSYIVFLSTCIYCYIWTRITVNSDTLWHKEN